MRQRIIILLAVLTAISGWGAARLQGQGSAPQTYSLTEDPGFPIMGPQVLTLSRDGSKEAIDQVMPVIPGRDKEYHGHLLYDFQAHTLYVTVLSDPGAPCGLQVYNDPAAPKEFDVISGAADLLKELNGPNSPAKQVGTESVNGIPARVMAFTSPDSSGKVWLAQNGGYPLRVVLIDKAGKETKFIEVKNLSFAKPPASAFAVPPSCASAQLPPPPAPPAKPGPNVTAVKLMSHANFTGACPAHVRLVGTITVDGPGTVFYQFGAGKEEPGETITFPGAGTKTVAHVITFPAPEPQFGNQIGVYPNLTAIGVDGNGNHGIPTQGSNNSTGFNITCTSRDGK